MEFNVGQRVVAVSNGVEYGRTYTNMDYNHNYEVGWEGTVVEPSHQGSLSIRFDNGREICGCMNSKFKEAEETMKFEVGDTVEVIDNSGDSDAIVGDRGKVLEIGESLGGTLVTVRTTDGREYSMYPRRFKLIKEEQSIPRFAVGSKVIVADGSYSMEFADGKVTDNNCAYSQEPCEVTAVNTQLPTWTGKYSNCGTNDTIIRRISDGRVFFVQQRFLKEYVPEPKFKYGVFVECGSVYARVVSSDYIDNRYKYWLTSNPSNYNKGTTVFFAYEDELKEAK